MKNRVERHKCQFCDKVFYYKANQGIHMKKEHKSERNITYLEGKCQKLESDSILEEKNG